MNPLYLTAALPYVNGEPHLGHALEYVQADVLARHARARGRATRFVSGTDDHAAKTRRAADALGAAPDAYAADLGDRFRALAAVLDVSFDDYLHTSRDARHAPAVRALWRALESRGDLYTADYDGLYCAGCEQFYGAEELLPDGTCSEHATPAAPVHERNWFFRLSRYAAPLRDAIKSGRLRIEPLHHRNATLAFLSGDVRDLSVSRDAARCGGWGITVPGDPSQMVYVWLDALTSYVSALGFATADDTAFREWWCSRDVERIHVVGKGIVRFHAVYWCAFLVSARLPLPDAVLVHDYLTVDGAKIGKSLHNGVDPFALAAEYGGDALRWWLLREVPRVGDTDFTEAALVRAANRDLANGVGNLVQRVAALCARTDAAVVDALAPRLVEPDAIAARVDDALASFDFRSALATLLGVVAIVNAHLDATEPWRVADAVERAAVVAPALHAARLVAREVAPFVPRLAAASTQRLSDPGRAGPPVFARIAANR